MNAFTGRHGERLLSLLLLAAAYGWMGQGQLLELFDASARPIAVLESVCFR
jgi:hypothetical protein